MGQIQTKVPVITLLSVEWGSVGLGVMAQMVKFMTGRHVALSPLEPM